MYSVYQRGVTTGNNLIHQLLSRNAWKPFEYTVNFSINIHSIKTNLSLNTKFNINFVRDNKYFYVFIKIIQLFLFLNFFSD